MIEKRKRPQVAQVHQPEGDGQPEDAKQKNIMVSPGTRQGQINTSDVACLSSIMNTCCALVKPGSAQIGLKIGAADSDTHTRAVFKLPDGVR
jgi:hypothetical protein